MTLKRSVLCFFLATGCADIETTLPDPVREVFGLTESGSQERTIDEPLRISNVFLLEDPSYQTHRALDITQEFTDTVQAIHIRQAVINPSSKSVTLIVDRVDPQDPQSGRRQTIAIPDTLQSLVSGSPIGDSQRIEWSKLEEFDTLYYKAVSNGNSQQGNTIIERNSLNYLEYQAVATIVPDGSGGTREVVRAHMLLLNDLSAYPSDPIYTYDQTPDATHNQFSRGIYGYNAGYGIWREAGETPPPLEGSAEYEGIFLGRQRLALHSQGEAIPLLVAREGHAPVIRFRVNFASSAVSFTIDNARLTLISEPFTQESSAVLDIQGTGRVDSEGVSAELTQVDVNMTTVVERDEEKITMRNQFAIDEFTDTNRLRGFFYSLVDDQPSIIAGYLYAQADHQRSLQLIEQREVVTVEFSIDGVFLAE